MLANLIEFVSNHYVLSSLFVVLLILLFITETRKGGKSLSNRELTALVNSGEGVVLDVRVKKEFDAGHIVDALNIPYEKLVSRTGELETPKAKPIIVAAALGHHAGTASRGPAQAAFTRPELSGG